ncbi:MAG: hypothetical protein RLZZ465_1761 [Bacteroidota bacterium]
MVDSGWSSKFKFERLKNKRTKLRKFLLLMLLSFLLLTGSAVVLSRNHWVQNYLAQRMVNYLSSELKTKVELGYVEIDFLRNIRLERLRIYDREKDTLIEIRQFQARLSNMDFKRKEVVFSHVHLFKGYLKLGYHTAKSDFNIDFLVDYFTPPDTDTTPGKVWDIKMRDAHLEKTTFLYFNKTKKPYDKHFDPDYMLFEDINAQLDSVIIGEPWFGAKLKNISLKERSGLTVVDGSLKTVIDRKHMLFTDMRLKTPKSEIGDQVELRYNRMRDFVDVYHKVIFDFRLSKSVLDLEELNAFHDWFDGRSLSTFVNGRAVGTLAKMDVSSILLESLTDQTRIKASGSLSNLHDLDNFEYRLDLTDARVALSDLKQVVYELDSIAAIESVEAADISGQLSGSLNDVTFDGDLDANPGHFAGHLFFDFAEGVDVMQYDLDGDLQDWDVGAFAGNGVDAYIDESHILLTGVGITPEQLDLDLDLQLQQYQVMGRTLKQVNVRSTLDEKSLSMNVVSSDPRFEFEADAVVLDWHGNPTADVNVVANDVQFDGLGLESLPLAFSGTASLIYGGEDLTHSNATLEINQLVADHGSVRYFCNSQQVVKSESSGWSFSGDWLNGEISEGFDVMQTQAVAQYLLHNAVPERFDPPVNFKPSDFHFDIQLVQTSWLSTFVEPSLRSGPINFVGGFNQAQEKVSLVLGPMDIEFKGVDLQRLKFEANTEEKGKTLCLVSAREIQVGQTQYDRFQIKGMVEDGAMRLGFDLHDKKNRYNVNFNANSEVSRDSLPTEITSANFQINQEPWQLDQASHITLKRGNRLQVSNLMVNSQRHFVEMYGLLSERSQDTFTVELGNITPELLSPFFPAGSFDSLDFHLGGKLKIAAALGRFQLFGQHYLNDVSYMGYRYGSFDADFTESQQVGIMNLVFHGRKGPLREFAFMGTLDLNQSKPTLDAMLDLPLKTPVNVLQPFLSGIVTTDAGTLDGRVRMQGPLDNLVMQGNVNARSVTLGVDYLKTKYHFDATFQVRSNGIFTAEPILVLGTAKKGTAKATLALTHNQFKDLALDLNVYDAKNIRVIQTTEEDNDLFFGTAWGTGTCRISGPIDKVNIKVDMAPGKNSKLSILYPTISATSVAGNITFRNHFGQVVSKPKELVSSGLGNIEINVRANPELEAEFLIDKRLGDLIRGRGTGDIRILYDDKERFFLTGQYTIKSGEYVFSLPGINVLTQKITLDEGGKISWVGDPYNANLNLSGRVEKRISPAQLMMTSGAASGTTYPPTLIVSILNITGSLLRPQIGFDLQAPELASSTGSNSEVNAVIQRIRQDKDEVMRQSVALLIFGNFLPPSFSSGNPTSGNVISGAGVAGNSVSNIASTVMNDLFAKYGIPTRIQVNIADVRSRSGTASNAQVFVNSEWFLSDRLRLDLNYDPTMAMLVNSVAVPFNFNLEYMTRNENWRLKMFSRSNNVMLQQGSTTTNGVSGNTLGGGVVYRREFETFRRKKVEEMPVKEEKQPE